MRNRNTPSALKIILMGQLMVNLPVLFVILLSAFLLSQTGLGWNYSLILGVGIGWFTWGKLLDNWKNWALKKNVERDRLFKLGKIGFINFYRYRIIDNVSSPPASEVNEAEEK